MPRLFRIREMRRGIKLLLPPDFATPLSVRLRSPPAIGFPIGGAECRHSARRGGWGHSFTRLPSLVDGFLVKSEDHRRMAQRGGVG